MNEESDVTKTYVINYDTVGLKKGYYNGVDFLLKFNKEGSVNREEYQEYMEEDTDEEEMEYEIINNERENY